MLILFHHADDMQTILLDISQRLGVCFGSTAFMRRVSLVIALIVFGLQLPTLPFPPCRAPS